MPPPSTVRISEIFKTKGVEVILLHDRVDEWMVGGLTEFEGKALQSVAKGELDLGALADEPAKEEEAREADAFKGVTDRIGQALGDKVKSVRIAPADGVAGVPRCAISST